MTESLAAPHEPVVDPGPSGLSGDILIVDDSPANLLAIEAAIGDIGGRIVRAQSGTEALRLLLEHDFALVLLDIQMPSLDGYQTAQLIRERKRSRHTPIIFLTAYNRDDRDVQAAYELGAVDFLFKPIRPEVLRAKVRVFVELQLRTQEVARQERLLREHERRAREQAHAEERLRWEEEALRRQRDALARKAEELAREVALKEEAQRELTRINAELAHADRRKDEFIAMLGHELRNPLVPLAAGLEVLRVKLPPAEAAGVLHRTRAAMERQVQHLTRLVDDLLDVSRINSGKIALRRETVELRDLVNQAIATSRPLMDERGHRLELDLPEAPLPLEADGVRVVQIVANLLNNAARYTERSGRIHVRCRKDGADAVIEVADNGRGIPGDFLPHIFDLFVQQHDGVDGGLGLGLTLVSRLVALHGGSIQAQSPGLGQGSTFTVRLPLASDAAAAQPPPRATSSSGRSLRIALVEDNADIRETMRDLLVLLDHQVETAADGETGAALILAQRPDVAIVDVGLPRLDGHGVARLVREKDPERAIYLVALTGFGQDSDRARAFEAGFDAHLTKPASVEDVLRVLQAGASHGT